MVTLEFSCHEPQISQSGMQKINFRITGDQCKICAYTKQINLGLHKDQLRANSRSIHDYEKICCCSGLKQTKNVVKAFELNIFELIFVERTTTKERLLVHPGILVHGCAEAWSLGEFIEFAKANMRFFEQNDMNSAILKRTQQHPASNKIGRRAAAGSSNSFCRHPCFIKFLG